MCECSRETLVRQTAFLMSFYMISFHLVQKGAEGLEDEAFKMHFSTKKSFSLRARERV